ncbi:Modification methylase DpnIIA [Posidoniimonas corsicana]|uniref:site-specific DNA-methyltransferase (adenine-specific) n=1 Tax=Posidoniimonas corsicana TaxID=1938618 RepID=A0A5C5UZR9_9BACT|nr:DNA adenine methylase [Posidoniimonas corsicana]TWT31163.1 Modification methylase DpnIIA [Posidoniimonas corsicana]
MSTIKTQPVKWHGGKSYLASFLHSLAPPSHLESPEGYTHRHIAFAGGLGEFWNWAPTEGIAESVNDRNGELINFYRVLRDPLMFGRFRLLVDLTPLAEDEFRAAENVNHGLQKPNARQLDADDPVERAAAFFVRYRQSRQGLGRDYTTPTKRLRRGMNEQVSAWLSAVDGLAECHERLRPVEVRSCDFRRYLTQLDQPRALFYLDPPYLASTRSSVGEYGANEMTDDDHRELLQLLAGLSGRFMLSGYHSTLYDDWAAAHGFACHERQIDNKASSAKVKAQRVECVWTNYPATEGKH